MTTIIAAFVAAVAACIVTCVMLCSDAILAFSGTTLIKSAYFLSF